MRANIVGKKPNNFMCDTVSGDEACEISEKKVMCSYFSTSKPELGLILQGNDTILV